QGQTLIAIIIRVRPGNRISTRTYRFNRGKGFSYSDCFSPFDLDKTKSELEKMYPGKRIKIKPYPTKKDVIVRIEEVLKLKMEVFDGDSTGGDKSA
ncbi:MAG: hypothetical protein GY866_12395, partial [Proteobacteria bacterium]|nr:hypothetical protein [Pseudomonadota bacterium]